MAQTHRPEPSIGQQVPVRHFTVTPDLARDYLGGLALPLRDAPPAMLANAADTGNTVLFSQQRGHLWLRHEWEFFRPLEFATTYSVEGRVADIYPRRERTILLTETELRDGDGHLVSRQRHHQSFLLDQPDGEVVLRDPTSKEGARTFAAPAGRPIASLEKTITLEMCGLFFHGAANYHSDPERSRDLGFRDVVVGGRMTMGLTGELIERELGAPWSRSGRLLIKFTNVLWPGEPITVDLLTTGRTAEEPAREGIFGRVTKRDGTVVLTAEGSYLP